MTAPTIPPRRRFHTGAMGCTLAHVDGYILPERDIARDAERLHRLRTGRGWSDRSGMVAALQSAFESAGHRTALAEYDLAGNCTRCGESGRCPGVHIVAGSLPSRRSQVQQALAFDLPLFA